jgi:pyruvate dehydrogenase E1 component
MQITLTPDRQDTIEALELIETRLRWLSSWIIHNANYLRPKRDGLKVGGHQASCASMTAIMAALYFHALRPQDKVAVKPHAGPVLHAIHYLLGQQSLDQLQRFRGLGGAQSYPSRTKDSIPVDFSTGSVGLGVAVAAFSSLVQDYLTAHGALAEQDTGRMIALMGDAELDEGNIYECLIEGYKHDLRNSWRMPLTTSSTPTAARSICGSVPGRSNRSRVPAKTGKPTRLEAPTGSARRVRRQMRP